MKIKYPSLYATTEPATATDGMRGSVVRCTATRRALGFVWWSEEGGRVSWNFRRTDEDALRGTRNTERNAVQALRDLSNGTTLALPLLPLLDIEDRAHTFDREPLARVPSVVAPVVAPAHAGRIVWNDAAPAFDLSAAIAAGLKRTK